jgi:hypothetical protein
VVDEGEAAAAVPVVAPVVAGVPPVVAPAVVPAAGVDAAVGPATTEVVFKHVSDDPGLMEKGAVCATSPLVSRRVNPMLVPDAIFTVQVRDVELVAGKLSMAAPLGEAPGRTLK